MWENVYVSTEDPVHTVIQKEKVNRPFEDFDFTYRRLTLKSSQYVG